jgi:hypothetical protein
MCFQTSKIGLGAKTLANTKKCHFSISLIPSHFNALHQNGGKIKAAKLLNIGCESRQVVDSRQPRGF